MRRISPWAGGLLFLSLAAACQRNQEPVVARVGRSAITEAEFRRKLTDVAPDYQNYVLTPLGRRQFLDVLIRERLILEGARSAGVAKSAQFRQQMEQLRKEEEEKLTEARDYLLAKMWLEQLRKEGALKVAEDEVREYHRKYGIEARVRHILLSSPEEAAAAIKRIRSGVSFPTLAKNLSLDADTAADGGQMRPALYGEIIPELEIVFKMRVGEMAGPVRSKFGYHVLLKEGERRLPFEAAEERIRSVLEKQKLDLHLQKLEKSYPVEVVDAQLQ